MKQIIFLVGLLIVMAGNAFATTYNVSKSGSDANSCATAQSGGASAKLTVVAGLSCLSSSDTLVIAAGTYTDDLTYNPSIPAGSAGAYTVIKRNGTDTVTLKPTATGAAVLGLYGAAYHHIEFDGLIFDSTANANVATTGVIRLSYPSDPNDAPNNIRIKNFAIVGPGFNDPKVAFHTGEMGLGGGSNSSNSTNLELLNGEISGVTYCVYWSGRNSTFDRINCHDVWGYGIHLYGSGGIDNNVVSNNYFHATGQGVECTTAVLAAAGDNTQIHNNIATTHAGSCGIGISIYANETNAKVWNNTIYSMAGVGFDYSGSGGVFKNNLLVSTAGINNVGTGLTSATNVTSNSPSSFFVDAAGGNFSLIAGASTAIDQGTASIATGITACANGSLPDIGAIETLGTPTATVNGTAAVITVPNNCTSQMLPASSVTGWSFKKNGSADAVTANSLSGKNSFAATLTNAFVGGDTCLFSYTQTGNSTDNSNIGNLTTSNQEVLAFTDSACTNITTGTGTIGLSHWQVYMLQGSADTSWIAVSGCSADFTNCTVAPGARLWVRVKLRNNSGSDTAAFNLSHRWRYNGGSYVTLTTSYVNGIKVVGTGIQPGTVLNDGATLTQDQLTSNETTNIACLASRSTSSIPSLTLTNLSESECAQGIDIATTATPGDTYEYCPFKDDGTALTCSTPLKLTVGNYSSMR